MICDPIVNTCATEAFSGKDYASASQSYVASELKPNAAAGAV